MARAALELDPDAEAPFPSLLDAVRTLGSIEPRSRMRARRLLALAVATRAFPEQVGPDGEQRDDVISALRQPGLAPSETEAQRLLELLADPDTLTTLADWGDLIDKAASEGLLTNTMALRLQPCASELVLMPVDGEIEPVAQYTTHFCTDSVTVDQAKAFLEPSNWPGCTDLWCEMVPMGTATDGTQRYLEVIGPDCDGSGWKMRTCLEVGTADLPGGAAVMSYRKCSDRTASDGQVAVDEGSVTLTPNGTGGVCVETTKRLRFDEPFDGGGLAMVLCTFGWGTLAEDLVLGCAYDGAKPVTPWPGNTGPAKVSSAPAVVLVTGSTVTGTKPASTTGSTSSAATGTSATSGGSSAIQPVVGNAVDAVKACVDTCVQSYQAVYQKAVSGSFTIDDAVNEVAACGQRLVGDVATAFTLTVQAVGALGGPTSAPTGTPSSTSSVGHRAPKKEQEKPKKRVPRNPGDPGPEVRVVRGAARTRRDG
jgi:hypothetical protein